MIFLTTRPMIKIAVSHILVILKIKHLRKDKLGCDRKLKLPLEN
jgi:hypothetical protein